MGAAPPADADASFGTHGGSAAAWWSIERSGGEQRAARCWWSAAKSGGCAPLRGWDGRAGGDGRHGAHRPDRAAASAA